MQDKAADYRQEARQIRAVARQISLLSDRREILDKADRLDALAAVEEDRAQKDETSAAPSREPDNPLLRRARAAVEEAERLMGAQRQIWASVLRQLDQMKQIESDLDPLLPHPHWELAAVRALLAEAENSQEP